MELMTNENLSATNEIYCFLWKNSLVIHLKTDVLSRRFFGNNFREMFL